MKDELSTRLAADPPDVWLDAALAAIAQAGAGDLPQVSEWALAEALARPGSMSYGPLMMIAGAAAARSHAAASQATLQNEADLLRELRALQAGLNRGDPHGAALLRFGPIGARILRGPTSPLLDMELETEPDDTVFLWTSGVVALARRGA